jgi:hypothetical protein
MKKLFAIALISNLLLWLEACKKPYACFRIEGDENNIHVNDLVYFSSICSSHANEFFWEFSDKPDSVIFDEFVTRKFEDTGNVTIKLAVGGAGNNSSSYSKIILVKP